MNYCKMIFAGLLMIVPALADGTRVPVVPKAADGKLTILTTVKDDELRPIWGFIEMFTVVLDSKGAAVTGLTQPYFNMNQLIVASNANCGVVITQFVERQPGLYYMIAKQPNLPQCQWTIGDYVERMAVTLPNAFGEVPVKFSYR